MRDIIGTIIENGHVVNRNGLHNIVLNYFINLNYIMHCFMRFLHEPFQGKGHFAFRLLLPSRATIKAFVLRALRPDLTEINGAFHLPFYTSSHFAKVINGGSGGIIWE